MAISSKVIVKGSAVRIETREGKTKDDKPWKRHNVLIVGPACIAEVTFQGDGALKLPEVNKPVELLVEVDVFRDDDTLRAIEYLA